MSEDEPMSERYEIKENKGALLSERSERWKKIYKEAGHKKSDERVEAGSISQAGGGGLVEGEPEVESEAAPENFRKVYDEYKEKLLNGENVDDIKPKLEIMAQEAASEGFWDGPHTGIVHALDNMEDWDQFYHGVDVYSITSERRAELDHYIKKHPEWDEMMIEGIKEVRDMVALEGLSQMAQIEGRELNREWVDDNLQKLAGLDGTKRYRKGDLYRLVDINSKIESGENPFVLGSMIVDKDDAVRLLDDKTKERNEKIKREETEKAAADAAELAARTIQRIEEGEISDAEHAEALAQLDAVANSEAEQQPEEERQNEAQTQRLDWGTDGNRFPRSDEWRELMLDAQLNEARGILDRIEAVSGQDTGGEQGTWAKYKKLWELVSQEGVLDYKVQREVKARLVLYGSEQQLRGKNEFKDWYDRAEGIASATNGGLTDEVLETLVPELGTSREQGLMQGYKVGEAFNLLQDVNRNYGAYIQGRNERRMKELVASLGLGVNDEIQLRRILKQVNYDYAKILDKNPDLKKDRGEDLLNEGERRFNRRGVKRVFPKKVRVGDRELVMRILDGEDNAKELLSGFHSVSDMVDGDHNIKPDAGAYYLTDTDRKRRRDVWNLLALKLHVDTGIDMESAKKSIELAERLTIITGETSTFNRKGGGGDKLARAYNFGYWTENGNDGQGAGPLFTRNKIPELGKSYLRTLLEGEGRNTDRLNIFDVKTSKMRGATWTKWAKNLEQVEKCMDYLTDTRIPRPSEVDAEFIQERAKAFDLLDEPDAKSGLGKKNLRYWWAYGLVELVTEANKNKNEKTDKIGWFKRDKELAIATNNKVRTQFARLNRLFVGKEGVLYYGDEKVKGKRFLRPKDWGQIQDDYDLRMRWWVPKDHLVKYTRRRKRRRSQRFIKHGWVTEGELKSERKGK